MKKTLIASLFLASGIASAGVTPIAQCGETNGYSFFPNMPKEDKTLKEKAAEQVLGKSVKPSNWVEDGYKNGTIFLVQQDDGTLDIVIYNAPRKETFSAIEDGAKIYLLRKSAEEIAVLTVYPTMAEITTFMKSSAGDKVSILQSKNPPIGVSYMRSTMTTGDCKFVNTSALRR